MATYTSQYPPEYNTTYVKTTSYAIAGFEGYLSTDPSKSLTDGWVGNQWQASAGSGALNQFHIDLGSPFVIKRVYLENSHTDGAYTTAGVRHFHLWGSNDSGAFDDTTWGDYANWTELTTDIGEWAQHVAADTVDPQYALVTNTTAYRYYMFDFEDNWGDAIPRQAVRRIELQTEDAPTTNIKKVLGVTKSGISKISTISIAQVKKVLGVS